MSTRRGLLAVVALCAMASVAQADIVATGSQPFTEPNGFYSGIKSVTVYTHDDPGNPQPGAAGELTYVYTIMNNAGSLLGIVGFNIDAPVDSVVAAGWIPDADPLTPAPSGVIDNNDGVVRWDWSSPDVIAPGTTAEQLYIISSYTPGGVNDTIYSLEGEFAFDLQSTCIGPVDPPVAECDLEIVKEGCVVQPDPPPGDACEGKLKSFKFQYTGLGCDASSNLQSPYKTLCLGGADGDDPVDILISGNKHKKSWGWWGWWNKRKSQKTFGSFPDLSVGDEVLADASDAGKHNFGSKTTFKIKTGEGWHKDVIELDKFDTSCHQPFGPGMQFGSILITEVTSTKGGTVTLPEDDPSEECVTEIDVTPPPHCQGKVTKLTLRYTGGDCSQTMHSQSAGSVGCFDGADAETYPVRIIVSDGAAPPPASDEYVDISPVEIGDTFMVEAGSCYHSNLTSTTGYWIKDAATGELVEDGFFHTSCSQPLNVGDQFGSLQVYAIDTTEGGLVTLENEVNYTYEVTNPNASDAINVSVDDDLLGNIASGETVAGGDTAVFTETAFISEETTNVATVNGTVDGVACNEGEASATITVTEPPEPGQICTTKVQAMRLRYEGPEILGARVEIEAKTFPTELVVYDPIDLIPGTELTLASENGFTIDATAHGEIDVGSKTKIRIDGLEEEIHTSCSTPFEAGQPAPLNNPIGDPSPNWFVVDFTQKD